LADWVEGLRAAARAGEEGDIRLAEALDITRFELYERYLDEQLYQRFGRPRLGRRRRKT
jgi:hypothetical protein